jgi:SAM-dependent methyltransferase
MADDLKSALTEFVRFARTLHGDEKSEAQSFLDHFFRALGHAGAIEAGATFEFRVAKKPGSPQLELIKGNGAGMRAKGGKKFADLLWPDRVLIEMKSRGEKLEKHYDQTFEYWTHIVPHRPPFVILCNFDEFWIYDFNTQLFDPVDRIPLSELPENIASFNFLLPIWKKPVFGNNRVEVTRKAADQMATVFREIVERGEDRQRAQRFILQLLVSMVGEDIALLPHEIVTELLFECAEKGASSYDVIGGLFRQMATREKARGGRFENVEYFNGGLFEVVDPIELKRPESYRLHEAARYNDWSKVRPEIFGALFQESMDKQERHAFGAHFTSEFDIRKVVGPTIVRPWRERIDAAGKNVGELRKALAGLRKFRVLDPACGSGNFLFIAYREMKRLERDILLRLREVSKREPLESAISLHQFFGIDIIPFAVELAKVTLMLAKELELIEAQKLAETDQLLIEEKPLPLDNLDQNIICADALFTEWPKADAIIGNPPYLGSKRLKPEHGDIYVNKLRSAYPDVPGMADYCVYWFRKAHQQLPNCSPENPFAGRAGLVGTQNIRNNQSRVGGLDYIVQDGTITEAVQNQPWSGAAKVHVSIVNWAKTKNPNLLPRTFKLWSESAKKRELTCREVGQINSSLSDDIDVSRKRVLACNKFPKRCFQGKIPGYSGFIVDVALARELAHDSAEVVVPYLTGRELLGEFRIDRWIIDFRDMQMLEARKYVSAFEHCGKHVLPEVQSACERAKAECSDMAAARSEHLQRWWQFWNRRDELNAALSKLRRYIGCSRVTRRPIMAFISTQICPSDLVQVFAFDDDYSFGILQSSLHFEWFRKSSRLKIETDLRYSVREVFETYPWPQSPDVAHGSAVCTAARQLRAARAEALATVGGGLRGLYRLLELPGDNPVRSAQVDLDAAVISAYRFNERQPLLDQLLDLNQRVFNRLQNQEPVTAPGVPPGLAGQSWIGSEDRFEP